MGCPDDGTVEDTAVLEAVRKSADVYSTSLSELIYSHLNLFVALNKNLCSLICIDILLALAEIDLFGAVLFDEVIILIPVILIVIHGKAKLFLHTHHCRKLEETTLMLMGRRFADSYKAASPEQQKICLQLILNAVFMEEQLTALQAQIRKNGVKSEYQNGENQWGEKKSVEVDVYNAMIKNYAAVIRQLGDMLPQAPPADDELTQFLRSGGGGSR